jgi:hypothetical protein
MSADLIHFLNVSMYRFDCMNFLYCYCRFRLLPSKRVISSLAYNFVTKKKKFWELLVGLV